MSCRHSERKDCDCCYKPKQVKVQSQYGEFIGNTGVVQTDGSFLTTLAVYKIGPTNCPQNFKASGGNVTVPSLGRYKVTYNLSINAITGATPEAYITIDNKTPIAPSRQPFSGNGVVQTATWTGIVDMPDAGTIQLFVDQAVTAYTGTSNSITAPFNLTVEGPLATILCC